MLKGLSSTIKTVYLHSLVQFCLYVFDRKLVVTIRLLKEKLGISLFELITLSSEVLLNFCNRISTDSLTLLFFTILDS
jgi:hypothetical protein